MLMKMNQLARFLAQVYFKQSNIIYLLLCTCFLTGCYNINESQLQLNKLAVDLAPKHTPLSVAEEQLNKKGFNCDHVSFAPAVSCSRSRQAFLYTCIESVNLGISDDKETVLSAEASKIICAGL
jgi:hypothetical protein